jgi:hypothetical protein
MIEKCAIIGYEEVRKCHKLAFILKHIVLNAIMGCASKLKLVKKMDTLSYIYLHASIALKRLIDRDIKMDVKNLFKQKLDK